MVKVTVKYNMLKTGLLEQCNTVLGVYIKFRVVSFVYFHLFAWSLVCLLRHFVSEMMYQARYKAVELLTI